MKSRIRILFAVIIFSLLGFVVFCNTIDAATIFTDNFNSYTDGSLRGQGSWITNSAYVQVEDYNVLEGSKAFKIYEPFPGSFFAEKSGTSVNDGLITIYMKRIIGGTTSPQVEVQLKEGDNIAVSMKSISGFFRYFNGVSNSYSIFGPFFASNIWYALQIQWRSSDHAIRYNIDGGIWTNWTIGVADWATGLDTMRIIVADGVTFFDAIQENLITTEAKNPVLIVPGLLGTEMKKGDELLWADITRMINPLNSDNFMDPLVFSKDLTPADSGVYKNNVIKNPNNLYDYTDGLINEFENQGYIENEDIFTFPYDWRYGVSGKFTDGTTNADLLAQKIQDIIQQTGSDKVDVVAHSLGGLIVKKYVIEHQTENHIGKAIFVGVPNTGAPKAVKVLLQGDNFGVLGLNDQEIKKIAENMPAAYDLLPSQQYYDAKGSYIKTIDETQCFDNYTIPCDVKDLNYQESNNFLNDKGFNSLAINNAESLHAQSFDNFDLRTAGINLYVIDGCKSGTLGTIIYRKYNDIFGQQFSYDSRFTPGDNTVPLESVTSLPINQNNKYYALISDHGKMPSQKGIRQQVVNLISGSNLDTGTAWGEPLITQDISKCNLNGKAISVFSPIDIFVTDQDGNRLGLADDGSVINEIPNADFEIWGEHKFVYLPQDDDQTYDINLNGTGPEGHLGTFTIKSLGINNNQITKTEVFSNLPVTSALTGQININPSDNTTTLSLKQNVNDQSVIILPSATLDVSVSEDLLPPVSATTLFGNLMAPGIYKSNVVVEIKAIDISSGVLAIQYNLDSFGFQKIDSDIVNFTVSTEGKHSLTFFATDRAGNNSQKLIIDFEIRRMPTLKNQCKNDDWKNFGNTFKNQGDCVSFTQKKK